jgi:GNAT superfamily N-acetyltransferase
MAKAPLTTLVIDNLDLKTAEGRRNWQYFKQAYAIYISVFPESELDSAKSLIGGIMRSDPKKAPWIVALNDKGEVVGGSVLTVFNSAPFATVGYHFTREDFRRQGVGSALEQKAFEYAAQYRTENAGKLRAYCDLESPNRLGFAEILEGAASAGIDPWQRATFWQKQGYLPVVSTRTAEPFPYTLIPDAGAESEATFGLDLWAKVDGANGKAPLLNTKETAKEVSFWLYGKPTLDWKELRAPFNQKALAGMLNWHKKNPEATTSKSYLDGIMATQKKFQSILADVIAQQTGDLKLAQDVRDGKKSIAQAVRERSELLTLSHHTLAEAEKAWKQTHMTKAEITNDNVKRRFQTGKPVLYSIHDGIQTGSSGATFYNENGSASNSNGHAVSGTFKYYFKSEKAGLFSRLLKKQAKAMETEMRDLYKEAGIEVARIERQYHGKQFGLIVTLKPSVHNEVKDQRATVVKAYEVADQISRYRPAMRRAPAPSPAPGA